MLKTLPPSPSSPITPRRRGGQPSNGNALKHGYFAVHNPTPITPCLDPIQSGFPLSRRIPLPALYARAIHSIRQKIALTFDAASHAIGFNSVLTWQRALLRHLGLFIRYRKALARCQQTQLHLQLVASHILTLIRRDFKENGLHIASHSFRGTLELSDFNSSSSGGDAFSTLSCPPLACSPCAQNSKTGWQVQKQKRLSPLSKFDLVPERDEFGEGAVEGRLGYHSFRGKPELSDFNSTASDNFFLTASQWALLEPLLPDHKLPSPSGLVPDKAREPGRVEGPEGAPSMGEAPSMGVRERRACPERSRRGRPLSNPRPLLNAIFWKIANHARWQDLPAGSPPMLTCRRYYRRLYLTDRLLTLYTALYRDFLAHSGTDLPTLVAQGAFTLSGTSLVLSPTSPDTWQTRTALLLMQLAYQSFRRILRKIAPKTPPLFPSFDLRKLPGSTSQYVIPAESYQTRMPGEAKKIPKKNKMMKSLPIHALARQLAPAGRQLLSIHLGVKR